MNKQELINKYKELWNEHSPFYEPIPYTSMVELFLKELKQLDEPQPVKVPQFVAEFITEQKKLGHTLSYSIDASMSDIVAEWYWDNSELFALAWIFGYEVEEEKRYLVKIKGNIKENTLVYGELLERYFFTKGFTLGNAIYHHTHKELEEAGFGWVFDCEGVEVQEVEG